jgi:hypothetical protein
MSAPCLKQIVNKQVPNVSNSLFADLPSIAKKTALFPNTVSGQFQPQIVTW